MPGLVHFPHHFVRLPDTRIFRVLTDVYLLGYNARTTLVSPALNRNDFLK